MIKFSSEESNKLRFAVRDNMSRETIELSNIMQEELYYAFYSDNSIGWIQIYSLRHQIYYYHCCIKICRF